MSRFSDEQDTPLKINEPKDDGGDGVLLVESPLDNLLTTRKLLDNSVENSAEKRLDMSLAEPVSLDFVKTDDAKIKEKKMKMRAHRRNNSMFDEMDHSFQPD